ncbi:MAG: TAXI family TRAP transporter solute-binding subunit [Alphaproteobacteria bacterium]|nr:TAXI family TRAP transporter solute-binding subunit [Alphaproteobacteria bacterium]MBU0797273.1 TAXI family TRAP transporter solute-binding subunit [Alphaproteobacteria bacterium]MBU0888939.1 TAXI family TRAP transporter solute-binding subunit [Alphaproteobacteria bacterium]MBU1813959.1 TAXI family TRAP transporter solute-binding subunit [Alphaproteobacteria bacterium]
MTFRTMTFRTLATSAAIIAAAVTTTLPVMAQDAKSYVLSTATTGGTYYPVGVALATLMKVKLEPTKKIGMSAISSAGSGENVKLMREKQAEFAILQGLFGLYGAKGSGPLAADGPQPHIRSVTMLWPNVEHFVVQAGDAPTGTVSDMTGLKGKKFSIGARNSGTEHSNRFMLTNMGINPEDYDLVFQGYGPSADSLQNGAIAAASMPGGPPVSVITRVFAQMGDKVKGLEFTDEQAKKADGGTGLYYKYTIPAGTYPGQTKDWNTIAQPNFLAVHADVPEAHVYEITKTIFENLAFLNNIHAATKEVSLETAMSGLPVPLHPGAAKYYTEKGLKIAPALIAK